MDSRSIRAPRGIDPAPAAAGEDSDDPLARSSSSSPFLAVDSRAVHTSNRQTASGTSFFFDSFLSSSTYIDPALHRLPIADHTWSREAKRPAPSPSSPPAGAIPNSPAAPTLGIAGHQRTGHNIGGASPLPSVARGGKKRPRSSRRAPTTVLTTDTSNFRKMVQEFTGIPAPPFASMSPASFAVTGRLDLLAVAAPGGGAPSSPSLRHSNPCSSATPSGSTDDLALRGQLGHLGRPAEYLPSGESNIHHPLMSHPLKLQLPNAGRPALLPSPTTMATSRSHMKEAGGCLSHIGLDTAEMSNAMAGSRSSSRPRPLVAGLSGGAGGNTGDQVTSFIWSSDVDGGGGSGSGGGGSYQVKKRSGLSSSELDVGTGPSEGVSRGEGMVDSWICSSASADYKGSAE